MHSRHRCDSDMQNTPLPFTKFEYAVVWLWRELSALPLTVRALLYPTIHWRTGDYRLDWGGKARQLRSTALKQPVQQQQQLLSLPASSSTATACDDSARMAANESASGSTPLEEASPHFTHASPDSTTLSPRRTTKAALASADSAALSAQEQQQQHDTEQKQSYDSSALAPLYHTLRIYNQVHSGSDKLRHFAQFEPPQYITSA